MSVKRIILEILQPKGMREANNGEVIRYEPQYCDTCNGRGGWYIDSRCPDYDTAVGEHYKPCPVCNGSGKLAPVVVINWQPSGEPKPQFKRITV